VGLIATLNKGEHWKHLPFMITLRNFELENKKHSSKDKNDPLSGKGLFHNRSYRAEQKRIPRVLRRYSLIKHHSCIKKDEFFIKRNSNIKHAPVFKGNSLNFSKTICFDAPKMLNAK
jgi:hypothetical protein